VNHARRVIKARADIDHPQHYTSSNGIKNENQSSV
jgi:hypothetical protein